MIVMILYVGRLPQHYLLLKRGLTWIVKQFVKVSCEAISFSFATTEHFITLLMTASDQHGSLELRCTCELNFFTVIAC